MAEPVPDFPESWRAALYPRRAGHRTILPTASAEELAAAREKVAEGAAKIAEVLADPRSDPDLVALGRNGSGTAAEGVRLALSEYATWIYGPALFLDSVARLGLADAAVAWVEAVGLEVVYGHTIGAPGPGMAITRRQDLGPRSTASYLRPTDLHPIRDLLSETDDATYDEVVRRLAPYRKNSWAQRLAVAFVLPDQHDWIRQDLAELPAETHSYFRAGLRGYSGFEREHFEGLLVDTLTDAVTIVDVLGHDADQLLLDSLDWFFGSKDARDALLDVLSHLPTRTTLDGLLERANLPGVAAAFEFCAARAPQEGLAALDRRADEPIIEALRARFLHANPALAPDPPPPLPVLAKDDVPAILALPPWDRPKRSAVAVEAPDIGVTISWADGEQEEWSWDRWGSWTDADFADSSREGEQSPHFFLHAPAEDVRPLLADWKADQGFFYLRNPRLLVAKYELDAYPPALRLARAKPVIGAELLLPYLSRDVALLMGKWLATSRQFGGLAAQWFARHGTAGISPLIPLAVGKPTVEAAVAAFALARLDPELVRAAGASIGAADAVDDLLARDPLDLLPGTVPKVPVWLDLDTLPPVLSRDRTHRLGNDERVALVRMIAMSDLRSPYAGLALIAGSVDTSSLSDFSWALFCHWQISGYSSKDAWAFNALGYFGNEAVADRLAGLVERWPSDGMAQRAKRGAELLALMPTPGGLQHLSRLARSARSTPLRKHAAEVLDGVAADRGLLPEQLDDLLADDLGLTDGPVRFRDTDYQVRISDGLELVLEGPDGARLTALPKAADDDEKTVVAAWAKRRRTAKKSLADQARRLEEAMIVQRRWLYPEFRTAIAGHPVLSVLAGRLVWNLDGELATLDPLGDLVGPDGGLVAEPRWLSIAHPASADLESWRPWLADRAITQPFDQVERAVHDADPSSFWDARVSAASLHALVRRGWHWGPTGHGAIRTSVIRPFGAEGSVVLELSPGLSAVSDPSQEPDQRIESLDFRSSIHADVGLFSDLPASARSELSADLARLERRS